MKLKTSQCEDVNVNDAGAQVVKVISESGKQTDVLATFLHIESS